MLEQTGRSLHLHYLTFIALECVASHNSPIRVSRPTTACSSLVLHCHMVCKEGVLLLPQIKHSLVVPRNVTKSSEYL